MIPPYYECKEGRYILYVCVSVYERETELEIVSVPVLLNYFKGFVSLVPVVYFPMLIYVPPKIAD